MQHLIERNKKKDAIYSLFHPYGALKLMQECVWWTVYAYAKCVQPMWHLTCTQQQLAEIHVKIPFWSNLLGLLIGFHWVPSIHASTNVIPTGFVSRCRWSLSIWSISDARTCRVQASVRLLKMLRHIISKAKTFPDWCSVGTVLDCPPPEVLFVLASLSLWIFPGIPAVLFFLDVLRLLQVIRLHVLRCCNAAFGRSRWGDGVKVGHGPGTVKGSLMIKNPRIQFNPTLLSLCNYNAHVISIVQKITLGTQINAHRWCLFKSISNLDSISDEVGQEGAFAKWRRPSAPPGCKDGHILVASARLKLK